MKKLILAGLAALLLSATTASAHQPYWAPSRHREMARFYPAPHVWLRGERFFPGAGRFIPINDWRAFRLHRPPFGFYWVRAGRDFLLIDSRSGRIADVISGYW